MDGLRERRGRVVLVAGEAGTGKTSLTRTLLDAVPADVSVLIGGCDPLTVPRPFNPLFDWSRHHDPALLALLQDPSQPDRRRVLERALELMTRQPTVALIEDLHWADEATIEAVGFLARRLAAHAAVLILTYRPDEVPSGSPLAMLLGDLAGLQPLRVAVGDLSFDAVASLVGDSEVDVNLLHQRTGGNPFFLTECLAAGGVQLPSTVRDAVLTRAGRLGVDARAALDIVAAVPGKVELSFIEALASTATGVDECVAAGVLVDEGDGVRFRHELAREAIHDAIPLTRRRSIHVRALAALEAQAGAVVDHARCCHHAVCCGDVDAVLRHAPAAAAEAERAGSFREALSHLEAAHAHSGRFPLVARLDLLARLASLRNSIGMHVEAIEAYEQAIALARSMGDDRRRGELLAMLWTPLTMSGQLDRAALVAADAIAVLEQGSAGSDLALAYAQQSAQHMLARELPEAEPWGQRAIQLATDLGSDDVVAYALVQSGVALWMTGEPDGLDRIRRGIAVARTNGLHALVAQGLSQIGSGGGEIRRYDDALPALEECVAFAARHELWSRGLYALAWLGRCQLELGRWDEASVTVSTVLRSPRCDGVTRLTSLRDLGVLRARRGDPDPWSPLDEALSRARDAGLQRIWPVAAARAEAAWLRGDLEAELPLLREVQRTAIRVGHRWATGELTLWLVRAGEVAPQVAMAAPYAAACAGRHRDAAREWSALGCVYEEATVLADSGDDTDQLRALTIYRALQATPAARLLSNRRRDGGRSVPRGANAATKGNPGGLSDRELDVLALITEGCTNTEIAGRLHISVKTVGHHVSHILTKLGARSRSEAAAAAVARGLTGPGSES